MYLILSTFRLLRNFFALTEVLHALVFCKFPFQVSEDGGRFPAALTLIKVSTPYKFLQRWQKSEICLFFLDIFLVTCSTHI